MHVILSALYMQKEMIEEQTIKFKLHFVHGIDFVFFFQINFRKNNCKPTADGMYSLDFKK